MQRPTNTPWVWLARKKDRDEFRIRAKSAANAWVFGSRWPVETRERWERVWRDRRRAISTGAATSPFPQRAARQQRKPAWSPVRAQFAPAYLHTPRLHWIGGRAAQLQLESAEAEVRIYLRSTLLLKWCALMSAAAPRTSRCDHPDCEWVGVFIGKNQGFNLSSGLDHLIDC